MKIASNTYKLVGTFELLLKPGIFFIEYYKEILIVIECFIIMKKILFKRGIILWVTQNNAKLQKNLSASGKAKATKNIIHSSFGATFFIVCSEVMKKSLI